MSDHGYLTDGIVTGRGRFERRALAETRLDHVERFVAGLQTAGSDVAPQPEHEEVAAMLAAMPDNVLHAIAPHLLERLLDGWDARDALLEALDEAAPALKRSRLDARPSGFVTVR